MGIFEGIPVKSHPLHSHILTGVSCSARITRRFASGTWRLEQWFLGLIKYRLKRLHPLHSRGTANMSSSVHMTIQLNTDTSAKKFGPFTEHAHWVNYVAFSQDRKRVVLVSSSDEKTICIWDADTEPSG